MSLRRAGRNGDLELLLGVAEAGSMEAAAAAAGISLQSARHRLSRLYRQRGLPANSPAARAVWVFRQDLEAIAHQPTLPLGEAVT